MSVLDESDALHARVRAFARRQLSGEPGAECFDDLAGDIARFQVRHNPRYARLVSARKARLDLADGIPAVPVEAFRLGRVAVHPPELDVAVFRTSGTTGRHAGQHALRTTETYRALALAHGQRALVGAMPAARRVLALSPRPTAPPTSSLGFMMECFMEAWDEGSDATSWFSTERGVDVAGVRGAVERAGQPVLLLATAFALVALLETLGSRTIPLPEGSVVMPTGGFKGRTREVAPDALVEELARAFRIDPLAVVFEYGMTELSSQLYEGVLPWGALSGPRGVYLSPPWLRVAVVDPVTLEPVEAGQTGLARFVDLANVDSAVCIVTQDLVRARAGGVEWVGRQAGAPPRGCSLALEQMIP